MGEPYKLKKTVYSDGETPIIEVLYTVTVFFPTLNKIKKRRGDDVEDQKLLGPDGEPMETFDERSMEEKELVSLPLATLRQVTKHKLRSSILNHLSRPSDQLSHITQVNRFLVITSL